MYPNTLTYFATFGWRWNLKHPFKFMKEVGRSIRYSRQRIKRGYADCDWYNMYDWMIHVLPPMFRDMAQKGKSACMSEPFNGDPSAWEFWLCKLADDLESCDESEQNKRNEYYKRYMRFCMNSELSPEQQDIMNRYHKRADEIWNESRETAKTVFDEIGEHFFSLWD